MRSKEERVARKGMAGTCDVTRCCGPLLWPADDSAALGSVPREQHSCSTSN